MVNLFGSGIIEMPMKMKVWKEYTNLRKKNRNCTETDILEYNY